MASITLQDISAQMAKIDFAMLSTRAQNGALASRPMSNNGQVEYDGDNFFFCYESARTVADVERDPDVGVTFTGDGGLFGGPPVFIAIEGKAELIRDKARFEEHWTSGLDRWFEQGADTPGIVLIKVHAARINYWSGQDEFELTV